MSLTYFTTLPKDILGMLYKMCPEQAFMLVVLEVSPMYHIVHEKPLLALSMEQLVILFDYTLKGYNCLGIYQDYWMSVYTEIPMRMQHNTEIMEIFCDIYCAIVGCYTHSTESLIAIIHEADRAFTYWQCGPNSCAAMVNDVICYEIINAISAIDNYFECIKIFELFRDAVSSASVSIAVAHRNPMFAKYLVTKQRFGNIQVDFNLDSALSKALKTTDMDLACFLIANGAALCSVEALQGACRSGSIDMVEFVLGGMGNKWLPMVPLDDAVNCGAIEAAVKSGSVQLVKWLYDNRMKYMIHRDETSYYDLFQFGLFILSVSSDEMLETVIECDGLQCILDACEEDEYENSLPIAMQEKDFRFLGRLVKYRVAKGIYAAALKGKYNDTLSWLQETKYCPNYSDFKRLRGYTAELEQLVGIFRGLSTPADYGTLVYQATYSNDNDTLRIL